MIAVLTLAAMHVLPRPGAVSPVSCPHDVSVPAVAPRSIDPGALDEINERWSQLGIGTLHIGSKPDVVFVRDAHIAPQGYRLRIDSRGVSVASSDADGAFYAMMTLAQLPQKVHKIWQLSCGEISDAPKLRWRILSDDVSRGPLPTMRYFKERIRTIAAFKMNGYSPYMESVFKSPTDPLPAPDDGITPRELHELAVYAKHFHVVLIPEQQTFAHMHNTLRLDQYAGAAEFPHGFLVSPESQLGADYLKRIISQERAAIGPTPFFHVGSDETSTLGEGTTADYVAAHGGRSAVFAEHVHKYAMLVAPSRVMLWDDAIEGDPSIKQALPKNAVIINWHYGAGEPFAKYIATIASGGFDQMVAPGANNWNEVFPQLDAAIANENQFIVAGIQAKVLGLFQTVWHDDGETLYEATWYPVLYSAATAWGGQDAASHFFDDFSSAFFGADDYGLTDDETALGQIEVYLHGSTNKLFWADPFGSDFLERYGPGNLHTVRGFAERVMTHLSTDVPPLHQNAARVMYLAARRFDALARRYQIAQEVRFYYDHALKNPNDAVRDLFWCKYWLWEMRDMDEAIAPLYEQAWRYESREGHLASNLERYHLDAQLAIRRADAIDRATYQNYLKTKTLPDLDAILEVPKSTP
jgi:hexosaminidase